MVRKFLTAAASLGLIAASPALAELQPEELKLEKLAEVMQPHWVWLNDISFDRMLDGRAYLVDADSGQMLGMVSGGYSHGVLMITPDGRQFAMPATFHSRGTRGERTEVVTFYNTSDLTPGTEVVVPPKRYGGIPFLSISQVMPGGKHGLIYNFTPEQSVTVVDMVEKKLVGEYATSGCGLIFPTGPQKFFLICSDGALQSATLNDAGEVTLGGATKPLFPKSDPVTEKGVWTGSQWLFFSQDGLVYVIDHKGALPKVVKSWKLAGPADENWRPGGTQTAAIHQKTGRLYVLMHQGDRHSHKDPGTEIWVYDAPTGKRIQRINLDGRANSVGVSQDDKPLLYTVNFGETDLKVRDAMTGELLRKIDGFGPTMTVIQPAPRYSAK